MNRERVVRRIIAHALRYLRLRAGLSQREVARRMYGTPEYGPLVARWERTGWVSTQQAVRIVTACGSDIRWLFSVLDRIPLCLRLPPGTVAEHEVHDSG